MRPNGRAHRDSEDTMSDDTSTIIRDTNDRFRRAEPGIPGRWLVTSGLAALLSEHERAPLEVISLVQAFDQFTPDNDPYGTREFGSFQFLGETCFWKIDLYDNDLRYGSPDPADITKTVRVMTIMLASEY